MDKEAEEDTRINTGISSIDFLAKLLPSIRKYSFEFVIIVLLCLFIDSQRVNRELMEKQASCMAATAEVLSKMDHRLSIIENQIIDIDRMVSRSADK